MSWKKGRGMLGIFKPLMGTWQCKTTSDLGPLTCHRTFRYVLDKKYIQLAVDWNFDTGKSYQEICLFGVDAEKVLSFWSFTNDGKQSTGQTTDVTDIHSEAIGFIAKMPAGTARQFYWPDENDSMRFAVEAKNKQGWKRFLEHHYDRI